jgi:hypothetical protein
VYLTFTMLTIYHVSNLLVIFRLYLLILRDSEFRIMRGDEILAFLATQTISLGTLICEHGGIIN